MAGIPPNCVLKNRWLKNFQDDHVTERDLLREGVLSQEARIFFGGCVASLARLIGNPGQIVACVILGVWADFHEVFNSFGARGKSAGFHHCAR